MLTIGLTGGIGSGKSAAAERFAQHDIPVIDADVVARDIVAIDSEGLQQVIKTFGDEFLQEDGNLDRTKLREHIFTHPEARTQLEAILHPLIRSEMQKRASKLDSAYCIFVIPLLLESNQQDLVDRILVIDCSEELQRQRVIARDGNHTEQVNAILASQIGRKARLAAADDVVTNEGSLDDLHHQIDLLHQKYLSLSRP